MPSAVATGVLRRALRNAGLLLGGKGAAGLMQLATLALAARTLGLEQFGLFSVMLAQMQLLITLATFQSNQAIVRYGVLHLNEGDRRGFQRLVKFGTMLDLAAALVAAAIAFVLAPILAELEGWDRDYIPAAQLLALLALMNAIATPKGMLRLFGRFDLLARQVTATPLARLAGTVALSMTGGSLLAFAAVWVIAAAVGAAVILLFAWREARRRELLGGIDLSLKGATVSNPGIWRFSILSNLHSSFALLPPHIATIVVGLALGPAAAGLTRVAQEIGTALAKPIDLINQTVYPDIARLAAASAWKRLRRLIVRTGATALGIGALMTLILYFAGEAVIRLIFGPEYDDAYWLLVLISLGTALKVSMFAAEPTLYALGRPSLALISAIIVIAAFLGTLFAAMPAFGILAAGLAYVVAALATIASSFLFLSISLPRRARQ
jgi:O-antigen/teichoic acid export membrane protein